MSNDVTRQRCRAFLSVSDDSVCAERFIVYWNCRGIECGAITVISHYRTTGSHGIAARGYAPSATETVHYVTHSRIATLILNAPLFSFTPHSPDPRPRRRSRILTRPSRRPRENSRRPPASPLTLFPGTRTLLRVHARVSVHDLRRGAAACSASENFMTTSCSLYIWAPPIRATPRIDHVFGWYIYTPSPENIERGGHNPAFGRPPVKVRCRVSDFKARNMERISPMRATPFFLDEKSFHRQSFFDNTDPAIIMKR